MEKAKKKVTRVFICVITILALIFIAVVGYNVYKNRWHKIDFNVTSVTVRDPATQLEPKTDEYTVTIKGTAKTWFYDYNKYQFDLTQDVGGEKQPIKIVKSDTVNVNHKNETEFEYVVTTKDYNDVFSYIIRAENIKVGDKDERDLDIRLFMHEYDKDAVFTVVE